MPPRWPYQAMPVPRNVNSTVEPGLGGNAQAKLAQLANDLLMACFAAAGSTSAFAESVRLAWNPSPDAVAAYVVMHGTSSGVYSKEILVAGTATSADVAIKIEGDTIQVDVRAEPVNGLLPGLQLHGAAYAIAEPGVAEDSS